MKRRMNGYLLAGLIVTGLMAALILVGLVWTPYDPDALLAGPKLEGPSLAHWLGTDSFGRDIFSRVLQGAGTTFLIALSTVAIGAVCGTAVGALTGYFGGVVDEVLMRLNDALTAFPSILLALVLISILGPGNKYNVVIALGIVFIPSFARVTRTAFAALRDVNYVKSARLMGASSGRILVRQILPNTTQVLLPAITIGFNNAVLAEASMSYLGIGVTPPDASLGYMLSEAQGMLTSAPWYALGSGGAIVLLIFGVNPWVGVVASLAYGLSTYFLLIIGAGHITKMWALVYAPLMMGGAWMTLRGNMWAGGALTALTASLEIGANHPQITYYFLLAMAAFWISEGVTAFREKHFRNFALRTAVLAAAGLLAVGSNFSPLWYTAKHSKETMRGGSELASTAETSKNGLALDYATAWSYGRTESLNLLVPDFMGRESGTTFPADGQTAAVLNDYGLRGAAQPPSRPDPFSHRERDIA